MKTLQRYLSAFAIGIFGILHTGVASAAVTSNSIIPLDLTFFVPCANNGAGELVDLSGTLHVLLSATTNRPGKITIKSQAQPQGVSGVGRSTGYRYQGNGVSHQTAHFDAVDGFPFVFSYGNIFRVVGQGPGNNFSVHQTIHVTLNANGVATATADGLRIDCK